MPTLSINFDPAVIAHLMNASGDDTVHVTLTLGTGDKPPSPRQTVPRGPLAALMRADLLEAGTVLTFHQRRANRSGRAVVTPDGQLVVDGFATPYPSPSKAAEAVTGTVINGWTLWHLEDGRTLDVLRRELESRDSQQTPPASQ
ncbi:restriction system modified-DNA reader domain-containing protein [Streptomyces swartbergensis]|uniref:restriction system modified-DNA reader domain-containing protein n=1 Tax=Streptomyces swartbergensis TaxID=487165 RepID=UPI00382A0B78